LQFLEKRDTWIILCAERDAVHITVLLNAGDHPVAGRSRIVRDPDKRMIHIGCMDLEAVNLSKVVKPVIDGEGGLFVGLKLSGA